MNTILHVTNLVTPGKIIRNGSLIWDESGKIVYAGMKREAPNQDGTVIEKTGLTASPGFIDMHVHGGFGSAFGLGDLEEELLSYSQEVSHYGVTGFLLSISGPNEEFILNAISSYSKILGKEFPGAQPIGLHLEGPFLNPEKPGAFPPGWLRSPSLDEMRQYVETGDGWIKQVTLAPEVENAFEVAEFLREKGIIAAVGHSNADYETTAKALAGPFSHITHTFNAQSGLHHRAPGVVGAALMSQNTTAELIADGVHVHPAAMRILVDQLGSQRVCLITDAIPGAGLEDGEYSMLGQEIIVRDGSARLPDGTLAGSTATMIDCLRTLVEKAGVPTKEAAEMASMTPANVLGIGQSYGSLESGKFADIILFDKQFKVKMTIKHGKIIFEE